MLQPRGLCYWQYRELSAWGRELQAPEAYKERILSTMVRTLYGLRKGRGPSQKRALSLQWMNTLLQSIWWWHHPYPLFYMVIAHWMDYALFQVYGRMVKWGNLVITTLKSDFPSLSMPQHNLESYSKSLQDHGRWNTAPELVAIWIKFRAHHHLDNHRQLTLPVLLFPNL